MERIANDLNGRVLTVKVFSNNQAFHITNIYAPSEKQNKTELKIIISLKIYIHIYIYSKNPLILAGDFNCIENPLLDKYPPTKTYPKPQTVITLTTNLNLNDTYRILHPSQTTYSHHAPNTQSRLDRFYVNPTIKIQNHVFIPTPFSDHDLITLSIALPSPTNHKTNHPCKNNISTYKIIDHQTQLSNVINNEMQSENRSNPLQK